MSNRNQKKMCAAFAGIFIFVLLVCAFGLNPQTTHAAVAPTGPFVPSFDAPTFAQSSITAVNTTAQSKKVFVLDKIVSMAAKIMLQNITNSVVNWINSGFRGSPAFVTDTGGFLTDVADQVAGNYIAGTQLDFLCSPFNISFALNFSYNSSSVPVNYCRLSGILSNIENFTKFTEGDFSQGGWDSWFQVTQNASGNPLGAYITAKIEMDKKIADALGIKKSELDWGKGFLSWKECIQMDINRKCTKEGPIKTPGSVIEDQLSLTLGTGVRQLELAQDINQIVNALIGQLVQTVLTQGLSSINSGSSGSVSLAPPLTVTCSPSQTTATVDDTIVWTTSVFGGDPGGSIEYLWEGSEMTGERTNATTSLQYTTTGTKRAAVTVRKDGRVIVQECLTTVAVPVGPEQPPLAVICQADPNKLRANINETITWTAEIIDTVNNIGETTFEWSGTDSLRGNTTSDDLTSQVQMTYPRSGTKTATVSATRNGQTVSSECTNSVEINPDLIVSCSPDPTPAPFGTAITWRARFSEGEPGNFLPVSYTWNIHNRTTTSIQENEWIRVLYPDSGIKTASVRIDRGSQSESIRCSPNATIRER